MMSAFTQNKAFSLLEVLMAAVIFAVSVAGIFVTITAMRTPVLNKQNQLAAAVFGQQVLEALYSKVDANTYSVNTCVGGNPGNSPAFDLSPCPHQVPLVNLPAGLTWPPALTVATCSPPRNLLYSVACSDGSTGTNCINRPTLSRQVALQIDWPNVATGTCP